MTVRAALRNSDFRRLFTGLLFGMAGESLLLLVLAIWANELTGTPHAAAVVLLLVAVTYPIAPVGGWLVDRWGPWRTLLAAYVLTAPLVLCLLVVDGPEDLWILYAFAVVYGASVIVVDAALNSLVVAVVPEEHLADANGVTQTTKQLLRLIGPMAGAGLYAALGGSTVALVTGACLVVAAVPVLRLRVRPAPAERSGSRALREITAGVRLIRDDSTLRRIVGGTAVAILALQMTEAALFSLVQTGLHRPPEFVGVLVSVQSLGGIAGGFLAPKLVRRFGEPGGLLAGCLVLATGAGLLAIPVEAVTFTAAVVMGLGIPIVAVAFSTGVQRRSPSGAVGRVSSTAGAVTSLAQVASLGAGAVLITVVDYRAIAAAVVAGLLGAALLLAVTGRSRPAGAEDGGTGYRGSPAAGHGGG